MLSPQAMLKKSEESEVYFLQFTRVYHNKDSILFFEGDDDEKYYLSRINSLSKKSFESISCKGKKSVLDVRDVINNHPDYCDNNNLYFIDSDFDDNDNEKYMVHGDIYITPSYAIENFYISTSCFELLLRSEFKCKESINKKEYDFILEHFCTSKNRFLDVISDFNFFVHSYRNNVSETSSKLNLKGLDTNKKFLEMCFNRENKLLDFNISFALGRVKETFYNITEDDIKRALNGISFSKEYLFPDREKLFRGKNLLWFMAKYLNFLKEDCNSQCPILFKKKRNCTLDFSMANIITVLSQYADTTQCLKDFIDSNLS